MALSATFVKQVKEPGRYGSGRGGHGLTLVVTEKAGGGLNKAWVQRIIIDGRETNLGLGSYPVVTLAAARERALANARTVAAGGDPRISDKVPTFGELAEQTIASRSGQWRGERNENQWRSSLTTHAASLMDRPVDKISLRDIRRALQPIWTTKEETARRVRQRIHIVMRRAVAEGHRLDNPAGPELIEALGPQSGRTRHFRSLHHSEVGDAIEAVNRSQAHAPTKLALEFLTLTAARPGEVYGCLWGEVNLLTATWTVPPSRTKTETEHRVPLSTRAMEVLTEAHELSGGDDGDLVFPALRGGMISDGTMNHLLRRLGVDCTPHGMRASFRSWCADTGHSKEAAEMALGHVVKEQAGAYQRSDLLDARRRIMEDWSTYLDL